MRGESIVTGAWLKSVLRAPDTKSLGKKTSIKGGGAGPEAPPVGPRPEEAEATQHPRATVMTGIEAGRRAEELGEGVRTA